MTEQDQKLLYIQVGIRIKDARENARLKQGSLAEMLHLSRASVVNIEKGRQRPSLHILYQIAIMTNCDLIDLLPALNREMIDAEKNNLKATWVKKISESSKGNVETSQKLTDFVKEITKTDSNVS